MYADFSLQETLKSFVRWKTGNRTGLIAGCRWPSHLRAPAERFCGYTWLPTATRAFGICATCRPPCNLWQIEESLFDPRLIRPRGRVPITPVEYYLVLELADPTQVGVELAMTVPTGQWYRLDEHIIQLPKQQKRAAC